MLDGTNFHFFNNRSAGMLDGLPHWDEATCFGASRFFYSFCHSLMDLLVIARFFQFRLSCDPQLQDGPYPLLYAVSCEAGSVGNVILVWNRFVPRNGLSPMRAVSLTLSPACRLGLLDSQFMRRAIPGPAYGCLTADFRKEPDNSPRLRI